MKKIIINGANGYVASNFINQLLGQEYEIIALVRGNKKLTANERMNQVLSHLNDEDFIGNSKLKVVNYSLNDENFGIPEDEITDIFSGDLDYYHFAASLKYDFKSKDEIFRTNIDGVKNSLSIYNKYAGDKSRFFFISTAYSCGKYNGEFREQFHDNEDISAFRNYYEQSKRFAENVIREFMEKNKIDAHIIRLSQVVGNSETGITKTDYGIFDFAKRMHSISTRYPNKEVRVKVDPKATQNLIPINEVIKYLMCTVQTSNAPQIVNLTAKQSTQNTLILDGLSTLIPLKLVPVPELEKEEMSSIERLVSVGMSFTGSYIDTDLRWETNNLDALVPNDGNNNEDKAILKMLEYFIGTLDHSKITKKVSIAS
ncbi:MAG: SDR family oxidoreductase [Carboxylicivirga sp.]|nr:SDR family oxidoreductase [Carboxylicivirga sp.]